MLNQYAKIIALIAIIGMCASTAMGSVVVQDVEIRGSIMDGNESCVYNYANAGFFYYDLDKNQTSETMSITFTDERTISKGGLVYECKPQMVNYTSPGLRDNTEDYGQYKIIGFRAEKYICYDNKTSELVKLLIEWDSGDKITLSLSDPMELPRGYAMVAEDIDLNGNKVWLQLYKDGKRIDNSSEVISGGGTYVYEVDDVLLFSAKIDSVFRGTESNMVVVKYIFMRSDEILDIDTGDSFGVMEVKSTASTGITLKNDDDISLSEDSEVEIMDGMYFKVADSTSLRYYLAKTIVLECPECPEMPECPVCPEPEPCPEVAPVNTANETVVESEVIIDAEPEDKPTAVPTKKTLPGFEAVFALAGLLAVAYIVLRQRKE